MDAKTLAERLCNDGTELGYAERRHIADLIERQAAELEALRAEVHSWRTRGRGLMLHDPELAQAMNAEMQRLKSDPAYALKVLQDFGMADADGNLTERYGGAARAGGGK